MAKGKKGLTSVSKLLIYLAAAADVAEAVINPYELRRRVEFGSKGSFDATVYRLWKRGLIKVVDKNAERFIKLTKQGQLEALIAKAHLPAPAKWDGKWRMVIFDIPEEASEKRLQLRTLLKRNGFYLLQASVYVNPYPLNRAAIEFLKASKLNAYIRIMRIDEIDNDADLRKYFNL